MSVQVLATSPLISLDGTLAAQRKLAETMELTLKHKGRGPEYEDLQRKMNRLERQAHALDPKGDRAFNYEVWKHSGKPFRKSKGLEV